MTYIKFTSLQDPVWERINDIFRGVVDYIARDADALSNGNGIVDDSERNAIGHTHTSAKMSSKYGRDWAEAFGDAKEWSPGVYGPNDQDEWKDQYNNEIGRQIDDWMRDEGYTEDNINPDTGVNYTEEELDEIRDNAVMDAFNEDAVIKEETDPRIDVSKDPKEEAEGKWYDATTQQGGPNEELVDPATGQPDPGGEPKWTTAEGRDYTGVHVGAEDSFSEIYGQALGAALETIIAVVAAAADAAGNVSETDQNAALDAAGSVLQGAFAAAAGAVAVGAWMTDKVLQAWEFAQSLVSPLVLDLDGDGIELISLTNSTVTWDLDEDGYTEHTGWAGGDDGFLAIDINGDGVVTDHTELFGNATQDGFTILANYDTNADNVIDSTDTQFTDLLVWQDVNEDGVSESSEIFSLADLNIVSIDLNAATPYQLFQEGHHITHTSTYTVDDGVSGPQTLDIYDVWFEYDNTNTDYKEDYTLDILSLFVTTLRGYGDLPDLHIASSLDNDTTDPNSLMSLLANFTSTDFVDLFVDDRTIMDQVRSIMLRWAGVEAIDPSSRGQWVDARELEFLEALTGYGYLQLGNVPNPGSLAGEGVDRAFETALYPIVGKLVAQVAASELFNGNVIYNPLVDSFEGFTTFNQDALDDLVAKSNDGTQVQNKTEFWVQVVNAVDESVGIINLNTTQYNILESSIQQSDSTLTIVDLQDKIVKNIDDQLSWTPDGDHILGVAGVDTYTGTVGDDFYDGGHGDDVLSGGLGNDQLRGNADNDIIDGQLGDDTVWGGHGDDTYLFFAGHGNDTLLEASGNDKVLFGAGIVSSDISFERQGSYDLVVKIEPATGGHGSITIQNQFAGAILETLEFDDGTTLDLNSLDYTYVGDDTNETVYGVVAGTGGSGNDTMYGGGGDDILYGYGTSGSSVVTTNTLYGEDGNDTLYADAHGDHLDGGAGNDLLRGHNAAETLVGGTGDDTLEGKNGDDVYVFNYGDGNDTIYDTNGSDKILFGAGITAAMITATRIDINDVLLEIDGGLGGSIMLDNQTYGLGNVIETIEFDDGSTLDLTAIDYTLDGTASNDFLYGVRFGGSGDDTIYGHAGNDTIYGYRGVADAVDNTLLSGGDGNDTIYGAHGIDTIHGDAGDDFIRGHNGNDIIYGGTGADRIEAGNHNDTLYGDDGNDLLFGQNGNDTLYGGSGLDELTGGGHSDTFLFKAATSFDAVDIIKDFHSILDAIDISDILSSYDPLTDLISDFVQITDDGTDSTLAVDSDGGADNFVAIAIIENRTGLTDEAALETSGALITA